MTVIAMSRTELSRLRVMIDLADGRTRVEDAAALMGLQRRQVYRLLEAFRAHGPDALIPKRRGKPSNRAHGAAFRQTCLAIVRERYEDFGPTWRPRSWQRSPTRLRPRDGSSEPTRPCRTGW
jgi:transposase